MGCGNILEFHGYTVWRPVMELLHRSINIIAIVISLFGSAIIIWGVTDAIIAFLKLKFTSGRDLNLEADIRMRQKLGSHLVLGLEIFIAADIISSVASPSWNKVGILAAIVGIRTVLSFFLTKELQMMGASLVSEQDQKS